MVEQVCFYFDPICPWCYQTSRWARRLEQLGVIELDWRLFSLELQNAGSEPEELAAAHAHSERGLRTAVAVRDVAGAAAVGRFYEHLGRRFHEEGEAMDEPATADQVAAEHRELCDRTRSFGVPTIQLDGGSGPAIFGPVITEVPDDDDAVALWEHVSWLTRHGNFAELKRDRVAAPDLESVRRWRAEGEQPEPAQRRRAS